MKRIYLLLLFVFAVMTVNAQWVDMVSSTGEKFKVQFVGQVPLSNIKLVTNPEELGQIKGVVMSVSGEKLKGAQIFISSVFSNRVARSKKDGSYTIGSIEADYTLEAIAPGYKKYVGEVTIKGQEVTNLDITLEPDVEGVEKMNGKGSMFATTLAGYTMKVASSHPAYKGKSLWYLLNNSPMIVFSEDKITVDDNAVQIFFNGRESRAPFVSLKAFCENIKIEDVVEVKVVKSAWAKERPPHMIYITYKE